MRAILWLETPGYGNEVNKVVRFFPDHLEKFRPDDVNSSESWLKAGWKPHSAGGITALEWGGGSQKGGTRLVTVVTLEHS